MIRNINDYRFTEKIWKKSHNITIIKLLFTNGDQKTTMRKISNMCTVNEYTKIVINDDSYLFYSFLLWFFFETRIYIILKLTTKPSFILHFE